MHKNKAWKYQFYKKIEKKSLSADPAVT